MTTETSPAAPMDAPAPQKKMGRPRRILRLTSRRRLEKLEQQAAAEMPDAARATATEGVRRLLAYQDWKYARLYLDHLKPVREIDEQTKSGGALLHEVARHLADRMAFRDVIRVAQVKAHPAR